MFWHTNGTRFAHVAHAHGLPEMGGGRSRPLDDWSGGRVGGLLRQLLRGGTPSRLPAHLLRRRQVTPPRLPAVSRDPGDRRSALASVRPLQYRENLPHGHLSIGDLRTSWLESCAKMGSVAPVGVGQDRENLAFLLGDAREKNSRCPGSCSWEMTGGYFATRHTSTAATPPSPPNRRGGVGVPRQGLGRPCEVEGNGRVLPEPAYALFDGGFDRPLQRGLWFAGPSRTPRSKLA